MVASAKKGWASPLTSTPLGSYTYDYNGNRKTDPSGAQYTWDPA